MLPADNETSFLNRISIRRNQFFPPDHEVQDLDSLQKHISDRFSKLLPNDSSPVVPQPPPAVLSLAWFQNLLEVFLCCEAEFKTTLINGRDPSQFSKPPMDRLIRELLERSVKALDICNAVTHGMDLIHYWQNLAVIAVAALRHGPPLGDGQARRAQKALTTLLSSMFSEDRENTGHNIRWTERSRSFGRRFAKDRPVSGFRSFAKSWSASKQIQNMSSNLVPPRGGDMSGPALPVYIMNTILVFVMWAMVAAIPCQERNGLSAHIQIPRQLGWAQPIITLQDKIGEDWKKKEKKGTTGLLEELLRMEKAAQSLVEHTTSFVFPINDEKAAEIGAQVAEMEEICWRIEDGLNPLRQQVREVFHRLVRSRSEILDVVDQITKMSSPVPY